MNRKERSKTNTLFKGIDVSKWQGEIDWPKVKNAGVQFAMLRCGYGKAPSQADECFEKNYRSAKANGIPVGAYHYSYAVTPEDAEEEARFCLSLLRGKTFEFPIAFDVEADVQRKLSKKTIAKIIRRFCGMLEAAGYYVAIYANLWWLEHKIDHSVSRRYDVWLAHWARKPGCKRSFGMWQYTSSGSVDGISGRVDRDCAYKNYPAIMRKKGLNGFRKETQKPKPVPAPPSKPVPDLKFAPRQTVRLSKTPLYVSSTAKRPAARKTGTYYIYDGKEIRGRYRLTSSPARAGKRPVALNVTGWINESDLKQVVLCRTTNCTNTV